MTIRNNRYPPTASSTSKASPWAPPSPPSQLERGIASRANQSASISVGAAQTCDCRRVSAFLRTWIGCYDGENVTNIDNKSNLSRHDFRGKRNLVGRGFRGAILRGTDFRECDLRSADFRGADCAEALFDGARFGRFWGWSLAVQGVGFVSLVLLSYVATMFLAEVVRPSLSSRPVTWVEPYGIVIAAGLVFVLLRHGTTSTAFIQLLLAVASTYVVALAAELAGADTFDLVRVGPWAIVAAVSTALVGMAAGIVGKTITSSVTAILVAMAVYMAATIDETRIHSGRAEPYSFPLALTIVGASSILFERQARMGSSRFRAVIAMRHLVAEIGGTRFEGANLSRASFRGTRMSGVRMRDACLAWVDWRAASKLDECNHNDSALSQPAVCELLTKRVARGTSLLRADLHGTDLSGADLRHTNLKEANLTGALMRDADLTGACIEAWNIDSTTQLNDVKCDYVFLAEQPDEKGSRQRRPADPERVFEVGEFGAMYAEAVRQLEILLKNDLPFPAIGEALTELRHRHPGVDLRKLEVRGDHILLGLDLAENTDEAAVDRDAIRIWEEKYLMLEEHYRDMKEIALAAKAGVQQIGGVMVYRGIQGNVTIQNSQVASVTGDVRNVTQSLTQRGGEAAALAVAIEKLTIAIEESKVIPELEKHEAAQQVATVAKASDAPTDAGWAAAAGKAMERLTALLGKAPDLTKLLETMQKAWIAMAGG